MAKLARTRELSAATAIAVANSPTRRAQPSSPQLPTAALLAAARLVKGVSEKRATRALLFSDSSSTSVDAAAEPARERVEGDVIYQLERELLRLRESAADAARERQAQRDEGCVSDAALRRAMQADGLQPPEQQELAREGVANVGLYQLLSDDDLWQAGIARSLRRREWRVEQQKEQQFVMDAAHEEEEVQQRRAHTSSPHRNATFQGFQGFGEIACVVAVRDAGAVCGILTPVLRQMSEAGKAATASTV